MYKYKKLGIGLGAIVLLILLLHFVPFDNRNGYLVYEGLGNDCIGYSKPVDINYRWIKGEVNTWDEEMNHIVPKNPGCAKPVHMRLFIL